MVDKYLMDGHKLHWHLDRVTDWLNGKKIIPIHIDVGLSKGCNIRCHYCFGVLQGNFYRKGADTYFPRNPLLRYMREAGEVGVRSMGIIGEAEPTLNPNLYDAIIEGDKAGVDISLGTNGILFDDGDKGEKALEHLKWIRFNISAASDESYRRLHGSKDFAKAIEKIKFCVDTKRRKKLDVTIGLQMVLTPLDVNEAVPLAKLGKELGVDYLVIKQCSDTLASELGVYDKLSLYKNYTNVLKEAEAESTENYNVIPKWHKIREEGRRDYKQCLGPPFLLYSSGDGKLFPCGMFFTEKYWDEFLMGDLIKDSFKDIIKSDRYWEVVERVKNMGVSGCYAGCRTDAINSYLWKLKHPPKHVNFV